MPDRIVISDSTTGLQTDVPPFAVNNDAYPVLQNFYAWRSRIRRKRGTQLLGRLRRKINSSNVVPIPPGQVGPIGVLSITGALGTTSLISVFTLGPNAVLVPGSLALTDGTNTFTDNGLGVITGAPGGAGTVDYATSDITITGGVPNATLYGMFDYYPCLPVMGCEDFIPNNPVSSSNPINYPLPLEFDTTYSYQYNEAGFQFYDVSFHKITGKSLVWSGQNFQQFWSANYYNATWVVNGKEGMHFKPITGVAVTSATTADLTIVAHGLIVGDRIWVNEVTGVTGINNQTGTVTVVIGPNSVSVSFPNAALAGAYTGGGIAQYLTSSIAGQDGIRWYDGDPTATANVQGWVNFAPPLSSNLNPEYLAGALALVPFKDRLLAFGPTTKQSNGTIKYYPDRVIYSQNGTPFYNTLVPINISPAPTTSDAWYFSPAGFGGFVSAGIQQPIISIGNNEDVLIVSFPSRQTRLTYTSNDYIPFLFYSINSEIGTEATFSTVTLDDGVLAVGPYGFSVTTQTSTKRLDLQIPDKVFTIEAKNNGVQRICAARDYKNEYVYFTYPVATNTGQDDASKFYIFPTETLVYNYRNNTWAVWDENYTTYGQYWKQFDYTWSQNPYTTWGGTFESWSSGLNVARYPDVIGGNQQGFVLIKGKAVGEAQSQYVKGIILGVFSNPGGQIIRIQSPNHCLQVGDFVNFNGMTAAGMTGFSTNNYRVNKIVDDDNFEFIQPVAYGPIAGTYNGAATYSRHVVPYLQTKQFQPYWDQARKVRMGTSRYLFDTTSDGQVTLQLFQSQNADDATNNPPYAPDLSSSNDAVIFSDILFTCPEPNNLQLLDSEGQDQIWHRMSTSMIGDSVQIGITLSDEQMTNPNICNSEITLYSIVADVYPSRTLI